MRGGGEEGGGQLGQESLVKTAMGGGGNGTGLIILAGGHWNWWQTMLLWRRPVVGEGMDHLKHHNTKSSEEHPVPSPHGSFHNSEALSPLTICRELTALPKGTLKLTSVANLIVTFMWYSDMFHYLS